jgi:hypothetical protein
MFVVTHLRERESRLEDASARTARATPTLEYCEGLQPRTFLQQSISRTTSRRTARQHAFRKYTLICRSIALPLLIMRPPASTRVETSLCELLRMRV